MVLDRRATFTRGHGQGLPAAKSRWAPSSVKQCAISRRRAPWFEIFLFSPPFCYPLQQQPLGKALHRSRQPSVPRRFIVRRARRFSCVPEERVLLLFWCMDTRRTVILGGPSPRT